MSENQVQVARIGKPHGIRGEVTAEVLTDMPQERFVHGAVFATEPSSRGPLTVRSARWNKGILLLGFEQILDRNAAEALRGTRLLTVAEHGAPGDDEADAWYEHELVGLQARMGEQVVGEVLELQPMPAQDLLLIRLTDGDEVLVPFVRQIVPEVSVSDGYLRLNPPRGLLELNRHEQSGG